MYVCKNQTRRKHCILPFVVTTARLSIECGYTVARAYTQTHTTSSDARQKYSGSNIQNTNVWFSLIRTDDVLRAYLLLIVLKIFFFLSQFFSGFHHEIYVLIYITQHEMNRLVTVSFSSVLFYQIKTIKKSVEIIEKKNWKVFINTSFSWK